jgi:hypothetical protein
MSLCGQYVFRTGVPVFQRQDQLVAKSRLAVDENVLSVSSIPFSIRFIWSEARWNFETVLQDVPDGPSGVFLADDQLMIRSIPFIPLRHPMAELARDVYFLRIPFRRGDSLRGRSFGAL